MNETKRETRIKWIKRGILLASVLAALKCIFVSLQMDEEYAITVPYRILQGDRLFAELWDPHQTSAFFIEFLLWIYHGIFHTYTYSVIFIRTIGVLTHALVTYLFWGGLRKFVGKDQAFYLAMLYFNLLPKGYVMPEFSNMMLWFLTLLLLAATHRIELETRLNYYAPALTRNAIAIGVLLSLMVLSYPTCVLGYIVIVAYLIRYDRYKLKSVLTVTLTCIVIGGLYLWKILSYLTIPQFIENIKSILESCGSHSDSKWEKLYIFSTDLPFMLLYFVLFAVLCFALIWLERLLCRKKNKEIPVLTFAYVLNRYLMSAYIIQILHWVLMLWQYESSYFYCIYCVIFGATMYCMHHWRVAGIGYHSENKVLIQIGNLWIWSNVAMYVAILLLTNLTLMTSIKYLSAGVVACLAILLNYMVQADARSYKRYANHLLILMVVASIFVKGYAYIDNDGLMKNITGVRNVIDEGPAKGIFTEYMQGYMVESNYQEFKELIPAGSTLLAMDSNTLCYMYQDVKVGSFTTICTPSYGPYFKDYWERYPDHYPDVIAIPCWYGEMKYTDDNWMVHYANTEFHPSAVVDGKYFRYYFRNKAE